MAVASAGLYASSHLAPDRQPRQHPTTASIIQAFTQITTPLSFLQAGCPSCRPTNSVKALKASFCSTHTQLHTTILDKVVHCFATLASVLHWKCHYWVTVAATGHRGPLTGTKSYCLVTDTQRNNLPDRLPLQFRMEK